MEGCFPYFFVGVFGLLAIKLLEGASFVPHEILKKAKALAIEFFFSFPHKGDHPSKVTTLIGWHPPPQGFVKLSTDESVLGNPGQASAGGVLRDRNGNWIRGFSHNLGITNSLVVELWSLRDGLLLTRELKICKFIVEIDAKSVVDLLKSESLGNTDSHPYRSLINDCKYLILSFETVSLHHAYQKNNFYVDLLERKETNFWIHFLFMFFFLILL